MRSSFGLRNVALKHVLSPVVVIVFLTVGLAGCGSDEDLPERVPVSGKVIFKGETLKDATVMFHPQEGEGQGHPAHGQVGPDGTFTLTTFEEGDGAVLGKHVVTVQIFPKGSNPGFEDKAEGYIPIPKKYTDPSTSDLIVEVKPDTETIDLKLDEGK